MISKRSFEFLQIKMNVWTVHIAVTHKQLVLTLTEVIVVLVKPVLLVMGERAQVYNINSRCSRLSKQPFRLTFNFSPFSLMP